VAGDSGAVSVTEERVGVSRRQSYSSSSWSRVSGSRNGCSAELYLFAMCVYSTGVLHSRGRGTSGT